MDVNDYQQCAFEITLRGKDVTKALHDSLLRLHVRDNIAGEADECEVEFEDVDGRWRNAWYPAKGDILRCKLGRTDLPLVDFGDFEIDQITFCGPPSTVLIRALSAGVQKAVRTREGKAFEKTTLAKIVAHIAKKNRLTVVGKIQAVEIDRVTQFGETDTAFLTRLGVMYGYVFKIKGQQLVFTQLSALNNALPALTVTLDDIARYRFVDKITEVQKRFSLRTQNVHKKRVHLEEGDNTEADATPGARTNADTKRVVRRQGTASMTRAQRDALKDDVNDARQTSNLTMARGDQRLVAGLTMAISGLGKLDGNYLIDRAMHNISRNEGYSTEVELKRVAAKVLEKKAKK